jgi:predicted transcriptional regulator
MSRRPHTCAKGRGGKGGCEPRIRVRQREEDVVQLATEGHSQHEIARLTGISQPAVSKILRRVDERWLKDNAGRLERFRVEQARKSEHLYREALRAWEQSKAQRTRRRQRKSEGPVTGAGGVMAEVIVDDSHGDPRYLEAARRALADVARLWGVNAGDRAAKEPAPPAVFTLKLGDERTAPTTGSRRRAAAERGGRDE